MCEWTESDSLRKHMLAVETAVRAYARKFGADEETWAIAGLVHDLDYERYPDLETGHPRMAIEELRRRDYPEEVVHAVQAHAERPRACRARACSTRRCSRATSCPGSSRRARTCGPRASTA